MVNLTVSPGQSDQRKVKDKCHLKARKVRFVGRDVRDVEEKLELRRGNDEVVVRESREGPGRSSLT